MFCSRGFHGNSLRDRKAALSSLSSKTAHWFILAIRSRCVICRKSGQRQAWVLLSHSWLSYLLLAGTLNLNPGKISAHFPQDTWGEVITLRNRCQMKKCGTPNGVPLPNSPTFLQLKNRFWRVFNSIISDLRQEMPS